MVTLLLVITPLIFRAYRNLKPQIPNFIRPFIGGPHHSISKNSSLVAYPNVLCSQVEMCLSDSDPFVASAAQNLCQPNCLVSLNMRPY